MRNARATTTTTAHTHNHLLDALGVVGLVTVAAVLYRPWKSIPFPLHDLSGWLATLGGVESGWQGFLALVDAQRAEGRTMPIAMAFVCLNWTAFGMNPVGWQILRFALMAGVTAGSLCLLRLLGLSRGGALVGALLFVLADSARATWMMLQVFDVVAVVFMFLGIWTAARAAEAARYRGWAIWTGLAMSAAILTRETFIATLPFVLLIAAGVHLKGSQPADAQKRRVSVILIVGAVVGVTAVLPVLHTLVTATPQSYSGRYTMVGIESSRVMNVLQAITLPITRVPWFPANAAFLLIVLGAAWVVWRSTDRRRTILLAGAASALLACGIVVYLPWPGFPGHYGFAFLFGTALVFALAVERLWWRATIGSRLLVAVGVSIVCAYGVLVADNDWERQRALRTTTFRVGRSAFAMGTDEPVWVLVDDPSMSGSVAHAFRSYAIAHGWSVRRAGGDVACPHLRSDSWNRAPAVVVSVPDQCSRDAASWPKPTQLVAVAYHHRDYRSWRQQTERAVARIWYAVPQDQ
jgi:hypothetical protein